MTVFLLIESKAEEVDDIEKNEDSNNLDDIVDIFTKCYEGLGCVQVDSKWYHKKYRPVNLRPMERHIIKTDILLLKRSKEDPESLLYNSMVVKSSSIKAAGFSNDSELMILIHDFTSNGYTGWIKHVGFIIFDHSLDYNVISIDWQRGAEPPYDQAIANARVVALEIINLLKELKEKMHYSLDNIYIVGHGIGAHIAGYVGATYKKIKKITGLDPSGPRFTGMPDHVKLNPSCAQYVEIIHTDIDESRSQGINETLGHSDFYVNGGKHQPGCPKNSTFSDLVSVERSRLHEGEILPGCDHKRSFKYFVEALSNKNCTFMGIKCHNDPDFENGKCTSCNDTDTSCRIFGLKTYRTSLKKTKYFLNTADQYPFCMFQYRINIFVKDGGGHGYFDFILIDENANVANAVLSTSSEESNYRKMKGGQDNTFVYYAHQPHLGSIKEAKVRWNQMKQFYCFVYCKQTIDVEKINIKLLSNRIEDNSVEIDLCPPNGDSVIEDASYKTFSYCTPPRPTTTHSTSKLPSTKKKSHSKHKKKSKNHLH
ncbi:hypothetical protein JTB14_009933 [Gonioctena quinquepunctata]|nr:hypothetical protein JTB14_009933 [Gonioctena quinquepunctata]